MPTKSIAVFITVMIGFASARSHAQQEEFAGEGTLKGSRNLGFTFGALYSDIFLDSDPYFADSAGKVGRSVGENSYGGSIGVFYNVQLGKSFLFRPAVECVVLPAKISYDTDINYKTYSNVWPGAVEIPLTLIYSRHISGSVGADKKYWPEFGVGIRPVLPLNKLADLHPTFKTFNMNVEASVGFPVNLSKATMRIETFYSYGVLNIIGEDDLDYKTYTVNELRRSYFGLRFLFN